MNLCKAAIVFSMPSREANILKQLRTRDSMNCNAENSRTTIIESQ